jgi:hypothetical protein
MLTATSGTWEGEGPVRKDQPGCGWNRRLLTGGAAVVPEKPSKDGGGMGGSYSRQDDERCGGLISLNKENISQIQKRLAQAMEADPSYRAKRLFNLVYHPDWLAEALERVLQNQGSQTPG